MLKKNGQFKSFKAELWGGISVKYAVTCKK